MNIYNYITSFISSINHPNNRGHLIRTIFRIFFWKFNQLTFKTPALISLSPNIKCICYPDSSYGGMVVYTTYPDYEVVTGIKKNLPEGGVFVDVGANIGFMSLIAATVKKSKIHAFEPSPTAYPRLVENINLNNLSGRVKSNNMIVSSTNKSLSFFDDERSELSHIAKSNESGKLIRGITLDTYSQKNNIKKIDVLKIDVEGAELGVLKGASKMLQLGNIKHIYCELNSNSKKYGYSNTETIKYLKSVGYRHSSVPKNIDNITTNIHAWKNR